MKLIKPNKWKKKDAIRLFIKDATMRAEAGGHALLPWHDVLHRNGDYDLHAECRHPRCCAGVRIEVRAGKPTYHGTALIESCPMKDCAIIRRRDQHV